MSNRYVCCNVNDTINKQRFTIVKKDKTFIRYIQKRSL